MLHLRTIVLPALLIAAATPAPAFATDRYFRDQTVFSPNRQFRLEAKSPDNAGEYRRPFASHFVYTMKEAKTGKVLWTHRQAEDGEGSPMMLFIGDDGRVAVLTGWHELLLLSAKDGSLLTQFRLLEQFPEAEQREFVAMTTAGPMWTGCSHWYFLPASKDSAGAPHAPLFVCRPYWGTRIVVDCDTLKPQTITADAESPLRRALDAHESTWAAGRLALWSKRGSIKEDDWAGHSELQAAILIAGQLRANDSAESLLKLQGLHQTDRDGGSWASDGFRGLIHLSLRRLDLTPTIGPIITLRQYDKAELGYTPGKEITPAAPITIAHRAAKAHKVAVGQTMQQVVDLIGSPDYQVFRDGGWGHCFEYDMDPPPIAPATPGTPMAQFTLRIRFNLDTNAVDRVESISPAVWLDGRKRDRDLAN